MNAFRGVVRTLALLALVTGAADIVVGLGGQQLIGAALPSGYGDPLLNSQIRFLAAIWFGFGVLLWHCLRDVRANAGLLRGAFWIVFLGGIGRVVSVVQVGMPSSIGGSGFVVVATLIEIVGMPVLLAWLARLVREADTPEF